MKPRVAFYAPMKPPDHPVPSGDREMARLFLRLLAEAGYAPEVVSRLRSHEAKGDAQAQAALHAQRIAETTRLCHAFEDHPPALWFTYHCYYKAPDLLGPELAGRCGIPYIIAEPSRARKRLTGPWARFAETAERAIDAANLLLAMTPQDRFALDRDATPGQRIVSFPPCLDVAARSWRAEPIDGTPLLLAVAMMRVGAKTESYARLARALTVLDGDWTLHIVGDGPEREAVKAMFARFGDRIALLGRIDDPDRLSAIYCGADAFVWPGVDEAWGMAYLEAQAAGTPAIAEDRPGPHSVLGGGSRLAPEGDAAAFAAAIRETLRTHGAREATRAHAEAHHDLRTGAALLRNELENL